MEQQDRNQLDDLFEGALKHYGNVEPRPGLEGRVLARLAGARNHAFARTTWAVASAILSCACVLIVVGVTVIAHRGSRNIEVAMPRPAAFAPSSKPRDTQISEPETAKQPNAGYVHHRKKLEMLAGIAIATTPPRLSQFPSQRPLSEQEQLLKQYVRAFPQEATIIAREQTLREQEFEKLLATQYSSSDSD